MFLRQNNVMNVLSLPDTILIDIFEYLSYDEVAKKREVCRRFDQIGQSVLNAGFNKVTHEHGKKFKRIKSLLPRRESERRVHYLARHADILTSIETRISMLTMTYSKYMDLNLCCFIPGLVLDEIYNILAQVEKTTKPLRPHEVLQELRDISSMAIEHFDEKIAVNFKKEQRTKMTEQGRMPGGGLSDISFSGVHSPDDILHPVVAAAITTSRSCDEIIKNVQEKLGLSQTKNPHRLVVPNRPIPPIPELPPLEMPVEIVKDDHVQIPMASYKRLENGYQDGLFKLRRMRLVQIHQKRRLHEAHTAIAELTTQVSELKKQIEDVVANNHRELQLQNAGSTSAATTEPIKPLISRQTLSQGNETASKRLITANTTNSSKDDTLPPLKKPKV